MEMKFGNKTNDFLLSTFSLLVAKFSLEIGIFRGLNQFTLKSGTWNSKIVKSPVYRSIDMSVIKIKMNKRTRKSYQGLCMVTNLPATPGIGSWTGLRGLISK